MTICLNMIVKNESEVIERCLESVIPLIDSYCIVDTGSNDGTQDLIRAFMEKHGIPGNVHERQWVDFAHNRSEAIQLAKGQSDYLLFIDADDILEVDNTNPVLTEDAYPLPITYGEMQYGRVCIVRNDGDWHYVGVLHEYPDCGRDFSQGIVHGIRMVILGGGSRSSQTDVEKYSKDAKTLEDALLDEPYNERYAFYLAQSYRDSRQIQKAFDSYGQRATMGGFDQEVWFSLYQRAILSELLDSRPEDVINHYLKAIDARPSRAEAHVRLAKYLIGRDRYGSAAMIAEKAVRLPVSTDALFVEPDCYTWKAIDELSIAYYYTGYYEESAGAATALLNSEYLPEDQRERVQKNYQFAVDKLQSI